MKHLTSRNLHKLPKLIEIPGYKRAEHAAGIVHLGTGGFHRAHQAVYTDTALSAEGGDWRIIGASLRSAVARDQLTSQEGLYTVVARDVNHETLRIIGAIDRVLFAPEDPAALISVLSDPGTQIVTLTITEKGYCHEPATGCLDRNNPDIIADINDLNLPQTAPGFLVAALLKRRRQQSGGMTILSCDNLTDNGKVTQSVILELASLIDPALCGWIEREISFPSSMVDRIVPAITKQDRQYVENVIGLIDQCPVITEPFSQWVIEDRFVTGRPKWETGGATFVESVAPFEKIKLRLLNGSHSCMAYMGHVMGIEFVHEVIANHSIKKLIKRMMDDEITPTLSPPSNFDLSLYKNNLIDRFSNAAVPHKTSQVAIDGSQKLPQRLLEPIRERLACGQSIRILCLGVASWMRYVGGKDEKGGDMEILDPLSEKLLTIRQNCRNRPDLLAHKLLDIQEIFGIDLPNEPNFVTLVSETLTNLINLGVMATIRNTLDRPIQY